MIDYLHLEYLSFNIFGVNIVDESANLYRLY